MAFTLPTFNLQCDVYTGPWVGKVLRLVLVPCNLALGKRTAFPADLPNTNAISQTPILLVPALTDIRDGSCATGYDVIECPSGSGRFYGAQTVDDIGKGFANEHRYVVLAKLCQANDFVKFPGLFWPTPIP